nr:unnamed protein product [Callosobruchus analis]
MPQRVQQWPRTNINDAFYSHQISFYCLCYVSTDSKNPIFYTLTENQTGRGSAGIASALINFLEPQAYDDLIFPVRGHSFLPAERCIERVEKLLRKHPTLISTKEYKNIYEELGEVREPGIVW